MCRCDPSYLPRDDKLLGRIDWAHVYNIDEINGLQYLLTCQVIVVVQVYQYFAAWVWQSDSYGDMKGSPLYGGVCSWGRVQYDIKRLAYSW